MLPIIQRAVQMFRREGLGVFMSRSATYAGMMYGRHIGERRYRRRAIKALHEMPEALSAEQVFDFASNSPGNLIKPWQFRSEFLGLLQQVFAGQPIRTFMEIGTLNGGTLFCFCRMAAPDAFAISLDLPGGLFGGGWPMWKQPVFQAFCRPGQQLHLRRANSHEPQVLADVQKLLNGRQLDFLFIDGDHTYEGVKADFEMYSPLVRPGGFVAFHDIVSGAGSGPRPDAQAKASSRVEVHRLWTQLRPMYKHWEFINRPDQIVAGIGIIQLP